MYIRTVISQNRLFSEVVPDSALEGETGGADSGSLAGEGSTTQDFSPDTMAGQTEVQQLYSFASDAEKLAENVQTAARNLMGHVQERNSAGEVKWSGGAENCLVELRDNCSGQFLELIKKVEDFNSGKDSTAPIEKGTHSPGSCFALFSLLF